MSSLADLRGDAVMADPPGGLLLRPPPRPRHGSIPIHADRTLTASSDPVYGVETPSLDRAEAVSMANVALARYAERLRSTLPGDAHELRARHEASASSWVTRRLVARSGSRVRK